MTQVSEAGMVGAETRGREHPRAPCSLGLACKAPFLMKGVRGKKKRREDKNSWEVINVLT